MATLEPQIDQSKIYHRSLTAGAALVQAGTLDDFEDALTPSTLDVQEGVWVTKDSSGEAVKAINTDRLAWPVWTDGGRYDVQGSGEVTVLWGPHIAKTDQFVAAGTGLINSSTAVGTLLGVDPTTSTLRVAQSGDFAVAIFEGFETAGAVDYIEYSTYGSMSVAVA